MIIRIMIIMVIRMINNERMLMDLTMVIRMINNERMMMDLTMRN